jgi:ADP-heptose:LPS heptosyltransferase
MHGALGDFILAMGPFKAIRGHHPDARIVLLTTPPFADLGRACGYFDDVWEDTRPAFWRVADWAALRRRLLGGGFVRVYDLQTSDRTGWYFRFFPRGARPEWSGIAPGCSLPHNNPNRNRLHAVECQAEQLAIAGITEVPPADVSWLTGAVDGFDLRPPYVLLVPGGSPHRPAKRWPVDHYARLAQGLSAGGHQPVLIGGLAEADVLSAITAACPAALNLCGRTQFGQIAELARSAVAAVGNDTGPMHLIAAAGCPTLTLFSDESDPARCAPRGRATMVLRRPALSDLSVDEVSRALLQLRAR